MVLGQLNLDGFGVGAHGPLGVQRGVSVAEPGLQLGESVLELTQGQQGPLQLVLCNREKMEFSGPGQRPKHGPRIKEWLLNS